MRGYFGVGIECAKTPGNVGTLWRTAQAFGAAYIFTIGARYPGSRMDTTNVPKHVPLLEYDSIHEFVTRKPRGSTIVGVDKIELERKELLPQFSHPERAVYLLGAEDHGLSQEAVAISERFVEIPSSYCLNVAVAGSIVLYDRIAKS